MSDGVQIAIIGFFCSLLTLLLNRLFTKNDKKEDKEHNALKELRNRHNADMEAVNKELTVICYGVLAALKGLAEQGCDGPVHDAIDTLEKHLNIQAHS